MADSADAQNDSNIDYFLVGPEGRYYFSINFWIFLILVIINIPCCVYCIYIFFQQTNYRRALHNHITFVLIVLNSFFHLTDALFYLYFLRTFQRISSVRALRLFWGYIDWMMFYLQFFLFAWDCIERHILIFHDHLVASARKRFLFHYLPPILITLYCIIYYTVVIFGSNCENIFPDDPAPSFYPCAFIRNHVLFMYDTLVHQLLSNILIILFSLWLLIRVLHQKYRAHGRIRWRQHRRMIIQLLSVSFSYFILPIPYCIVMSLYLSGMPNNTVGDFIVYYSFFGYYALALYPVICMVTSPEFAKKFAKLFRRSVAVQSGVFNTPNP